MKRTTYLSHNFTLSRSHTGRKLLGYITDEQKKTQYRIVCSKPSLCEVSIFHGRHVFLQCVHKARTKCSSTACMQTSTFPGTQQLLSYSINSCLLWNVKCYYRVRKNPPLNLILKQMNSISALTVYLRVFEIHDNIALPSESINSTLKASVTATRLYGANPEYQNMNFHLRQSLNSRIFRYSSQ